MSSEKGLLNNFIWKFAERISAQLISTLVSIVLARLLMPEDYGVVSIVMIFITLANVFVSDGFGSALIQKKNANALDFFSVLYFNLVFSCVLYAILFLVAPYISLFYGAGYEILTPILRVLGLRIILTAVNSVQQAYISKKMMFKKFFISTIFGTVASAVVGLIMAYAGYGAWALVAQYLVNTSVSTMTLFFVIKKKPQFIFSFSSLKNLFPFGARVLGRGLLITGFEELRALIIGKAYSSADLAYYDKGKNFPVLLVGNVNSSIGAVLFPKMSKEQDNKERLKTTTRNSIRFSSYIMFPLMLGLAAVAETFVTVVLTEKWLPCVPLMQLLCIVYLFQPSHTANMQAIKALGRSDIYLRLEIIKKVVELIVLICVMDISVMAITIGMAACATAFAFINAYPNIKLLGYSIKEQLADFLPSLTMSLIMAAIVLGIGLLPMNNLLKLVIQVAAGGLSYIIMSFITKNEQFKFIIKLVFGRFRK